MPSIAGSFFANFWAWSTKLAKTVDLLMINASLWISVCSPVFSFGCVNVCDYHHGDGMQKLVAPGRKRLPAAGPRMRPAAGQKRRPAAGQKRLPVPQKTPGDRDWLFVLVPLQKRLPAAGQKRLPAVGRQRRLRLDPWPRV